MGRRCRLIDNADATTNCERRDVRPNQCIASSKNDEAHSHDNMRHEKHGLKPSEDLDSKRSEHCERRGPFCFGQKIPQTANGDTDEFRV